MPVTFCGLSLHYLEFKAVSKYCGWNDYVAGGLVNIILITLGLAFICLNINIKTNVIDLIMTLFIFSSCLEELNPYDKLYLYI